MLTKRRLRRLILRYQPENRLRFFELRIAPILQTVAAVVTLATGFAWIAGKLSDLGAYLVLAGVAALLIATVALHAIAIWRSFRLPQLLHFHNEHESREFIRELLNAVVIQHLEDHGKLEIYEANLQLTDPGHLLPEDLRLAQLGGEDRYTLLWHMAILATPEKSAFVSEWRTKIQSANERMRQHCDLRWIQTAATLAQVPNFWSAPELGIAFLGFGRYAAPTYPPHDGGGILILSEEFASDIAKVVQTWLAAGTPA